MRTLYTRQVTAKGKRSERGRLSRERIVEQALLYADAHGIESLTMRQLAGQLGFEVMALYRHVASKDEILDALMDRVLETVEPAGPGDTWITAIRTSARSLRSALRAHPWAGPLLTSRAGLRPARVAYAESLLCRLEDAGFGEAMRFHAYHLLEAHVVGYSLWEAGHSFGPAERAAIDRRLTEMDWPAAYPRLAHHHALHASGSTSGEKDAFDMGLDFIMDGLVGVAGEHTLN